MHQPQRYSTQCCILDSKCVLSIGNTFEKISGQKYLPALRQDLFRADIHINQVNQGIFIPYGNLPKQQGQIIQGPSVFKNTDSYPIRYLVHIVHIFVILYSTVNIDRDNDVLLLLYQLKR